MLLSRFFFIALSPISAESIVRYPNVLGEMFIGGFVTMPGSIAFVLEDDAGVCGYAFGVLNTRPFYTLLKTDWFPKMAAKYPLPGRMFD